MILHDAPGSSEIQDALENEDVREIVNSLLHIRERDKKFFKNIARFLQAHSGFPSEDFARQLEVLRKYKLNRIDLNGQRFHSSFSPDELFLAIEALYSADQEEIINYRRGAIVELLAYELVNSRCQDGECRSNQCLGSTYGKYTSKQVDVVVFSEKKLQIEGYSCKVKIISIKYPELKDLVDLSEEAEKSDYDIHIGVISFDNSSVIRQRLIDLSTPDAPTIEVPYFPKKITAYGLDNLSDLMQSPF